MLGEFKLSDFKAKHAFVIPHADGMMLEPFDDMDDHLMACKTGLLNFGFKEDEMTVYPNQLAVSDELSPKRNDLHILANENPDE